MNKQLQRKYEDSAFYTLLGFVGLSLMLCSVCTIHEEYNLSSNIVDTTYHVQYYKFNRDN